MNYVYEEFGYRLWNPIDQNVIRIKDVVLLEEQTIEDFKKVEKLKFFTRNYDDPSLVPPTIVNDDNEKDGQQDNNIINEPIFDNNVSDEHVKQVHPKP